MNYFEGQNLSRAGIILWGERNTLYHYKRGKDNNASTWKTLSLFGDDVIDACRNYREYQDMILLAAQDIYFELSSNRLLTEYIQRYLKLGNLLYTIGTNLFTINTNRFLKVAWMNKLEKIIVNYEEFRLLHPELGSLDIDYGKVSIHDKYVKG